MTPSIATAVYLTMILGMIWLDRARKVRVSLSLWVPIIWLALACSRSLGQWLDLGAPIEATDQVLEGSPVDRLTYSVLMGLGLIILLSRASRVGKLLKENVAVLTFFGYCVVSLVWSDYPEVAFKRWTKAVGDLIMVLVVLSEEEPVAAVQQLLGRTCYLLIPLSTLFIKYFPELGRSYGRWDWKTYYTGVTTNKNTLGSLCLFFGLASVWRLLAVLRGQERDGRIWKLGIHVVILTMAIWQFWIANSMTSLACFVLSAPLVMTLSFRKIARRPVVTHLLVVLVIALSGSALFFTTSILEVIGRNPTLTDRTGIWNLVLSLVNNPVLGTGFESFWLGPRLERMWAEYSWHPNQSHNGYVEIFLNLGWVGAALLGVVIVTGYLTVIRGLRQDVATGSVMLGFFTVGLVYNFTEAAFFRMMTPAWIFFLLSITRVPVSFYPKRAARGRMKAKARRQEEMPVDVESGYAALERYCPAGS